MNQKTATVGWILLAAAALPLHAQDRARNPGFQIGGAPPPKSSAIGAHSQDGHRSDNIYHRPGGTVYVEAVIDAGVYSGIAGNSLVPMAPPTPAVPATPEAANGSHGSNTSIVRSSTSITIPAAAISSLEPGTPRNVVLAQYGKPVAYILNMNGETLYFSNGVVVFLKDGVIARP